MKINKIFGNCPYGQWVAGEFCSAEKLAQIAAKFQAIAAKPDLSDWDCSLIEMYFDMTELRCLVGQGDNVRKFSKASMLGLVEVRPAISNPYVTSVSPLNLNGVFLTKKGEQFVAWAGYNIPAVLATFE